MFVQDSFTESSYAYVSTCEMHRSRAARALDDRPDPIDMYRDEVGDDLIAWMYMACGLPAGVVPVGTDRPRACGSSDTTTQTATPSSAPDN